MARTPAKPESPCERDEDASSRFRACRPAVPAGLLAALLLSASCAGLDVVGDEPYASRAAPVPIPAPAPIPFPAPVPVAAPAPAPAPLPPADWDLDLVPYPDSEPGLVRYPDPDLDPVPSSSPDPAVPSLGPDGLRGAEPGVPTDRLPAFRPKIVPRRLRCEDAVRIARDVASRHGLEAGLVLGVMRVESGFVANVISPAPAIGLMQVTPWSARPLGCGDLFDPAANAECGARILASFLRYYKGDLMLALSGYNAGHAMPDRARKSKALPVNVEYVENVLSARARFLQRGCDF